MTDIRRYSWNSLILSRVYNCKDSSIVMSLILVLLALSVCLMTSHLSSMKKTSCLNVAPFVTSHRKVWIKGEVPLGRWSWVPGPSVLAGIDSDCSLRQIIQKDWFSSWSCSLRSTWRDNRVDYCSGAWIVACCRYRPYLLFPYLSYRYPVHPIHPKRTYTSPSGFSS